MFIIELIPAWSVNPSINTKAQTHTLIIVTAHMKDCLFLSRPNAPSTRFDSPGRLLLEIVFPSLVPLSLPSSTETRPVRWNWLSVYDKIRPVVANIKRKELSLPFKTFNLSSMWTNNQDRATNWAFQFTEFKQLTKNAGAYNWNRNSECSGKLKNYSIKGNGDNRRDSGIVPLVVIMKLFGDFIGNPLKIHQNQMCI